MSPAENLRQINHRKKQRLNLIKQFDLEKANSGTSKKKIRLVSAIFVSWLPLLLYSN